MASIGTGSFDFLESAAASTGDLVQSLFWRQSRTPRAIVGFGLVGSAAIADAAVEILVDGVNYGLFYNTTAGASKIPTVETDIKRLNIPVPPGSLIQVKVHTAGNTNVLAGTMQLAPVAVRRRGRY